jgi:hypothetical protein
MAWLVADSSWVEDVAATGPLVPGAHDTPLDIAMVIVLTGNLMNLDGKVM